MATEKIISKKTDTFNKLFSRLDKDIQEIAKESFLKWKDNPMSVHFKPLQQSNNTVYSAQVNSRFRALAKKTTENGKPSYVWFWIGSHEDYNNVLNRLKDVSKNVTDIRNTNSPSNGKEKKLT